MEKTRATLGCATGRVPPKKPRKIAPVPIVTVAFVAFAFGMAAGMLLMGGLRPEDLELAAAVSSYVGCLVLIALVSRGLPRSTRDR